MFLLWSCVCLFICDLNIFITFVINMFCGSLKFQCFVIIIVESHTFCSFCFVEFVLISLFSLVLLFKKNEEMFRATRVQLHVALRENFGMPLFAAVLLLQIGAFEENRVSFAFVVVLAFG